MSQDHYTLFLDESGDHRSYPLKQFDANAALETHCTLVGVIVGHHKKEALQADLAQLKTDCGFSTDVILHSVEIRHHKGPFAVFGTDDALKQKFKNGMNALTSSTEPVIVCSSLNKRRLIEVFPQRLAFSDDPYEEAFEYLLERYAHFLNSRSNPETRGHVVAEGRNKTRDASLLKRYQQVKAYGTHFYKPDAFARLAPDMEFKTKKFNVPGLQLSDYCCYPFYKDHKYPDRDNQHFQFLKQFIYPGQYAQYGHKKWPI